MINCPEIDSNIYRQLIFNKGARAIEQRQHRLFFSTNSAGAIGFPYVKKNKNKKQNQEKKALKSYMILNAKINSKQITDLHVKPKTIRCLRENTRNH